jgi:hypothetical protein
VVQRKCLRVVRATFELSVCEWLRARVASAVPSPLEALCKPSYFLFLPSPSSVTSFTYGTYV